MQNYPVKNPRDWHQIGRLSLGTRLRLALRNRQRYTKAKKKDGIALHAANLFKSQLKETEVILICVLKNAAKYLPSFLEHYRAIGVKRFAFVDDKSDDETRYILNSADDVDVYESNCNFRETDGGLVWRDMLVDTYGRNRWYVSVDSDEYLVFPGYEDRPVAAFISDLSRHNRLRSLAAMIDIYPDGPLDKTPPHWPLDAFPAKVSPLFDGSDYTIGDENICTAIRGGPRMRIFGANMRLTKFPVIFADAKTQFSGGSHHAPLPLQRNFSPVHAVLLHYKFPQGATKDFQSIADSGSHAGGSVHYKKIIDHSSFNEQLDFRYSASRRFSNSQALVDNGFIKDLRT